MPHKGKFFHLHGSCYIQNKNDDWCFNDYIKDSKAVISEENKYPIILTNIKAKPKNIKSEDLLYAYHQALRESLKQSNKLIIFGYGFGDEYLNKIRIHHNNILVYSLEDLLFLV